MRGTSTELIRRLPESLAFLARVLKDSTGWIEPLAKAEVEVTPSQLEEIVRFGRQRIEGRTILRVARLYDAATGRNWATRRWPSFTTTPDGSLPR